MGKLTHIFYFEIFTLLFKQSLTDIYVISDRYSVNDYVCKLIFYVLFILFAERAEKYILNANKKLA